jgi:serine/threonine-protein kinase
MMGRYTLLRKLATGGMAEIFLAFDASADEGARKPVVIKRILPALARDPQFVLMFRNEAKVVAQLKHDNVVELIEVGQEAGRFFLAMEHIDGPHLRRLKRLATDAGTPLSAPVCAKIVSLACAGMAYAHGAPGPDGQPLGLIHRDISPDNLLVSRKGAVKVVDFGVAKLAGAARITADGVLKGKLAYMAPEQVRGSALDGRVDVFALGVVLHELLSGQRPFEGPNDLETMNAILSVPTPPLPGVDPALAKVVERALQKDRAQRYPSCQAMQADLDAWLRTHGNGVTAAALAAVVEDCAGPTQPVDYTPLMTDEDEPEENSDVRRAVEVRAKKVDRSPTPPAQPALPPAEAVAGKTPWWSSSLLGVAAIGAVGLLAYMLGHQSVGAAPEVTAPPPVTVAMRTLEPITLPAPLPAPVAVAPTPAAPEPTLTPPAPEPAHPARLGKAAARPRSGELVFSVLPWANVEIDGRSFGQTPLDPVNLEAGVHQVVLTNSDLKATQALRVEVVAGQATPVKWKF